MNKFLAKIMAGRVLLGVMAISFFSVGSMSVLASDYTYQQPYRIMANKEAERILVSETTELEKPYEEVGPIEMEAPNRVDCIVKIKRQALRSKGDAIVGLKYSAEITSNKLTCKGTLVRWKQEKSK